MTFLERESRYWVTAQAGLKDETLFTHGTESTWQWAQGATIIRWFTDGERRYGKALWPLASEYLPTRRLAMTYPFRKVWHESLEVAIKIKGSQGQRRVVWLKVEHPFTAISPTTEVHANRNEAQNAAIRRWCSAYRRRQNIYAKTTVGLQRSLDVQRLIHNWVRPHWDWARRPPRRWRWASRLVPYRWLNCSTPEVLRLSYFNEPVPNQTKQLTLEPCLSNNMVLSKN